MAEIVKLPKVAERPVRTQHRKTGAGAEIVIFPGVRYEQRMDSDDAVDKPQRTRPRKRRS